MLCLLFNFYKENAVREWSFKRAITIQTYGGYDPIPVPLNIIYRIYRIFITLLGLSINESTTELENVSIKKQSYWKSVSSFCAMCR